MDRRTQLELLDRIQVHRRAGRATDAAAEPYRHRVAAYTDPEHLRAERALLTSLPTIVGLSDLLPDRNTAAPVMVGDAQVALTRDDQGEVHALLNVCRHRGAAVVTSCGTSALLTCPYHGWSYRLNGTLASRRRPGYFEGLDDQGLVRLPVREEHGVIWVSGTPGTELPDDLLYGCGGDLAHFELSDYRLFTLTTFTRPINWKLVMDTFLEVYHIAILHRATIDPTIHSDYALFDAFGPHGRMVVTRKSIDAIDAIPRESWPFFEHTTIVWMLQPNTVLIYQQDHMQMYQAWPGATPDESIITVSIWVPKESDRSDEHWQRNFDLLIAVTDEEDFVTCAGMQTGFHSGAQQFITFGRNEPLLAHYERSLSELVAATRV